MIQLGRRYRFNYVIRTYGVPARRGVRVAMAGKPGVVTSAGDNGHINVRFDGESKPKPCHPTWEMKYFDKDGQQVWPKVPDAA